LIITGVASTSLVVLNKELKKIVLVLLVIAHLYSHALLEDALLRVLKLLSPGKKNLIGKWSFITVSVIFCCG
jgi:hypothetical protein